MWNAILRWSLLIASIALVIGAIFFLGSNYKDAQWQAKWNKEQLDRNQAIEAVKADYRTKEDENRAETQAVKEQLAEQARVHEVALAAVRLVADQRLRKSEERAGVYQRQAEAGPAQCRALADHAAQLDRSLEEGRSVVQELRLTLGQRDDHVRALSTQILADRKLFE